MFTTSQWILLGFIGIPTLLFVGVVHTWVWIRELKKERLPITEKLLRPPGESLRTKVEALDEKAGMWIAMAVAIPGFHGALILVGNPNARLVEILISAAVGLVLFSFAMWRFIRAMKERRNVRLGLSGERAVGEELNRLMREGCWVFHDVPIEPYGNVDHVILAPSGVYAVETKTRKKPPTKKGTKDYEVIFDGEALQFPKFRDTDSVNQAKYQAKHLGTILTKAVGESIRVTPVLTIPGWYVTVRKMDKVRVLNPKGIREVILLPSKQPLSQQLLSRIAYQVEQKCRDVEF